MVLAAAALAVQACSSSPGAPGRASLPSGGAPTELRIGTTSGGRLTVRSVALEDYEDAWRAAVHNRRRVKASVSLCRK